AELANAAGLALSQRAAAMERSAALRDAAEASRLRAEDHVRLGHIIQATRAGIWEWDLKSGLAKVDERWADQIGYRLDELPELNSELWQRNTHGDDWAVAHTNMQAHIRGEIPFYDAEFRMRHKDGHWIWIRSRGGVIARAEDGSALTIAGTHVDVSDRKAAERRQRENEAFLDRTGTVAEVGGWQFELANEEVAWTRETCRLHQVEEGHRPSLHEVLSYYPPDARRELRLTLDEAINNHHGFDLELPFVSLDGKPRWVRIVGTVEYDDEVPGRLIGAIQDVTTRRRAVEAMEVSERRFRRLFEQSTGLIFTHDLDGTLLAINPSAARELGYADSDLLGKTVANFVPAKDRPTVTDYLEKLVVERTYSGAINVRAADGSERVWQFTSVIDDEQGEAYALCHAVDVTESKRHERKLRDWSIRDPLTGCFNRRYLAETAANVTRDESWGCIALDLDNFKVVNDKYGHERGDQVLVSVANFLREHVRPDDIVVRSGGDEFLVLLKDADEETTAAICNRMDFDQQALPVRFTLSSAVRRGNDSLSNTLRIADDRLYATRASR
ncbi:MAG: PAS domain S-box protein, partial [Dokdonella sp.]